MDQAFEGWAIVELMGHRRLAGRVSEASQYGVAMLRLDVYDADGKVATQFYGGASIYCLTPTTEELARRVGQMSRPSPVQPWELPQLPEPMACDPSDDRAAEDSDADRPANYDPDLF